MFDRTYNWLRVVNGGRYFWFRFGSSMVVCFRCQNQVFKFEFMCVCSSVTFLIIVEKRLWINLEQLDQQDSVWVL